jgi:hypothetical protein
VNSILGPVMIEAEDGTAVGVEREEGEVVEIESEKAVERTGTIARAMAMALDDLDLHSGIQFGPIPPPST